MGNRIRSALQNGEVIYGARVRTFSTTVIQILGQTGVEYAYLDLEHAGFSPYDTVELQRRVMAADQSNLGLVVRLPSGEPSMIRTVLDAGVRTVIIPRVKRPTEVERALKAARFHYDDGPGERGFGTSPSNDWGVRPEGYTHTEDEHVLVGIMLETEAALQNAGEILSTPELGFAKIGAGDLAVSLGHPQEYESDAVQDAIAAFRNECQANDVPMGIGVSGSAEAAEAVEEGYRLVDIGGDAGVLRTTFRQRMDELQGNDE
jgi:2-dehydro-3-deoxyglucarate aldolase